MAQNPIQKYRDANKLTQQELANKLKVSRQLISFIESGKRPITPQNAKDWESILGIPRERLCPEIFRRVTA